MTEVYTTFRSLSTKRPKPGLARLALLAFAALACVLAAACGSSNPPPPPPPALQSENPDLVLWPHAAKAIQLRFRADRELNMYDAKAHSIQVCVYQFDNPEPFQRLARTQEGISSLLKAESFDKSVKDVVRLFVQPLEEAVFKLDRAENATFVGVVCGYFDSTPENSAKFWRIKHRETKSGAFFKTTVYSAGTLDLELRLTARALVEDEAPERKEPSKKSKKASAKKSEKAPSKESEKAK